MLRPLLAALAAWLALAAPLAAQGPAPTVGGAGATAASPAGPEAELLIRMLEDPQARERLIQRLRAQATAAPPAEETAPAVQALESLTAITLGALQRRIGQASDAVAQLAAMLANAPQLLDRAREAVARPELYLDVLAALGYLAAVILAGLAAELATRFLLARPRRAVEAMQPKSLLGRVPLILAGAGLAAVPIVAFMAAANFTLPLMSASYLTKLAAGTLITANVVVRLIVALGRVLLAPETPALRPFPLADETAAYLYVWTRRFARAAVYGLLGADAFFLLGLTFDGYRSLIQLVHLLIAVMAVVFILQNRQPVADWLRVRTPGSNEAAGADGPPAPGGARALAGLRRRLADIWHVLSIAYVLAIWAVVTFGVQGGMFFILRGTVLTVLIAVLVRAAIEGINRAAHWAFGISKDLAHRFPGLEQRANRHLSILRGAFKLIVYVAGLLALGQAWGVDTLAWAASDLARRLLRSLATILFILAASTLFWEISSALIERALQRNARPGGYQHSVRMRTLLPLLRNVLLVVLVLFVALVVLSELGFNTAPLLAGAGVIGLAIGFGSQALVKDVITGLFILFEDTINVGDVVEVDNRSGVVESISIRTIRLRDVNGTLHTIPFSAVTSVKNMSKDFGYYVFDLTVPFGRSVDEVMEALRTVDRSMREDPDQAPQILAPIEIFGVEKLTEFGFVARARVKTRPSRQWAIGREYNRRIKEELERLGIAAAPKPPTAYLLIDRAGSDALDPTLPKPGT